MKGVTILQTMKETHYAPGWDNKALIGIGLFCLTIIIAILIANDIIPIESENIIAAIIVFGAVIPAIAFVGCILTANKEETIQYQVLLSDNVVMSEFINNYTIIEQKGITFIVEAVEHEGENE